MRIKLKPKPKVGEIREKTKFLWWPVKIGNEIRWLEFARIKQQYKTKNVYCAECEGPIDIYWWGNLEFLPYDPVKDCPIYLNEGCAHVDGPLCNMDNCEVLKNYKK